MTTRTEAHLTLALAALIAVQLIARIITAFFI